VTFWVIFHTYTDPTLKNYPRKYEIVLMGSGSKFGAKKQK
jgi:hypothetical protein